MKTGFGLGLTVAALVFLLAACAEQDLTEYASMQQNAVVCADGPTLDGIDVSYYQETIDWDKVAQTNMVFAIIRTGDGYFEDPKFERNWAEAKRVGIIRGAYHFFRPNKDPVEQADIMIRKIGTLEAGDLPPVVDLESEDIYRPYSRSEVFSKVNQFIDRVEQATGRKVMIYAGYYWWNDIMGTNATEFASSPLWIPQYGPTCPKIPDIWSRWTMFQTSSKGRVNGISGNVDLDLFNGTMDDLMALTDGSGDNSDGGSGEDGLQSELKGVIFVDQGTGTSDMSIRLPQATVAISGIGEVSVGSSDAYWSTTLSAGTYQVTASAPGYTTGSRTCSVNAGSEKWCSVGLFPQDSAGGDSAGGDSAGGDDINDEHGGFDFDAPKGYVTGYVLAATADADFDNCTGHGVADAQVYAETGEQAMADGTGHFEFWVVPGNHLLGATAENFLEGAGDCKVISGQSVFCCIYAVPMSDEVEVGPWHGQEDQAPVGCSTTGTGMSIMLIPALALLLLQRKKKAQSSS